ncbi:MAG: hypothetical protein MUC42_02565, partial [Bryobacter sp.]|nr:hypothetical protein [Bryobacter sp.]
LVLAHPTNLGGRLGIKLPESVLGKMVITSDGSEAWALSSSGFISLPLAKLFDYPILMPETQTVFLAIDDCNKGLSRAQLRVTNAGKGKLTFAVPNTGAALVAQVTTGVAPSTINFVMEPGRAGVTRQAGTNLYTGSATNSGSPVNVVLASNDAINLPNVIKVFMNFRQSDQRGMVFPVPTGLNQGQGLWDILLDEPRGRLYLSNAGFNRVEVFDIRNQKFLAPIEVGQLPRSMAMSLDGSQLYIANGGGESIQVIDLESRALIDQVQFPPLPRAGNQGVIVPETIAMGTSGLQFIMSNGSFWKLVGNYATLRPTVSIVPATIGGPRHLAASANGETLVAMSGTGVVYQYNAIIDAYTNSRQVYNQTPISYFGPLAAANNNAYFLAGGQILSSSLTPVGGAERPGATQTTPSPIPGQPPIQTIVSAGQRNVAAVVPLNDNQFLRMTTPVRQAITSTTRDDPRTQMEIIDVRNFSESIIA